MPRDKGNVEKNLHSVHYCPGDLWHSGTHQKQVDRSHRTQSGPVVTFSKAACERSFQGNSLRQKSLIHVSTSSVSHCVFWQKGILCRNIGLEPCDELKQNNVKFFFFGNQSMNDERQVLFFEIN